ncbi:MAG: transglutaminase domain-containing protein [Chloroflexota bacterium]|nr:transglutaminase domain-containing protein [Chloroflexota bacterium]
MTSQTAAALTPTAMGNAHHPVLLLLRKFTPSEGWLILGVLLATLLTVADMVTDAAWAESPSLYSIVVMGVAMGLAAAKLPGQPIRWNIGAIVLGGGFVYWQVSTITEATGFLEHIQVLNNRLNEWGQIASEGGISTDTIPFALILASLAWIIGYTSAWATFKKRNIWLAVLPSGVAMFSNLSYLPEEFGPQVFLYMALAMLLIAGIHALNQAKEWQRIGFVFPRKHGLYSVYRGSLYALLALGIAVVLPARAVQAPWFDAAWEWARSPIDSIEDDLDRLFAALPDRKGGGFRVFGDYLPFEGPISLSNEPVFLLDSPHVTYLRARTYPTYSPQGWTIDNTEELTLGEMLPHSQSRRNQSRLELEYTVAPLFNIRNLPVSNFPLSSESELSVEVLSPSQYWLPLIRDDTQSLKLPDDLTDALIALQSTEIYKGAREGQAKTLVSAMPKDAIITELVFQDTRDGGSERAYLVPHGANGEVTSNLFDALQQDEGLLSWVRIKRLPPDPPDIVGMVSANALAAGDQYTVMSSISEATPSELRTAGANYPGWVTDTYLQMPDELPIKVTDLARDLTKDISNPYDKAKAIEAYLRTLPYDQDIPAPAFDVDGVEHFLFVVKRGYSDYFGSAMTVLLREAGVPSRMVAGYAPREYDETIDRFIVRESDSHGWSEAYFPGFGWVEFEPTPGRALPMYVKSDKTNFASPIGGESGDAYDEEEFYEEDDLEPIELPPGVEDVDMDGRIIAGILGGVLAVWIVWYSYRRLFVTIRLPAVIFERMCWLGALVGLAYRKNQTPAEYARYLSMAFPQAAADLRILGNAQAITRYSSREVSPSELDQLGRAWRNIRNLLIHRTYRRNPFSSNSESAST